MNFIFRLQDVHHDFDKAGDRCVESSCFEWRLLLLKQPVDRVYRAEGHYDGVKSDYCRHPYAGRRYSQGQFRSCIVIGRLKKAFFKA